MVRSKIRRARFFLLSQRAQTKAADVEQRLVLLATTSCSTALSSRANWDSESHILRWRDASCIFFSQHNLTLPYQSCTHAKGSRGQEDSASECGQRKQDWGASYDKCLLAFFGLADGGPLLEYRSQAPQPHKHVECILRKPHNRQHSEIRPPAVHCRHDYGLLRLLWINSAVPHMYSKPLRNQFVRCRRGLQLTVEWRA